jgi:hypothetical protein
VTVNDISRLIEYLEEQDERVELLTASFDKMIAGMMDQLSKYTETAALYKTALTKEKNLALLREDLCAAMTYTTSVQSARGKKKDTTPTARKEKLQALREASRMLGCDTSVDALVDIKNTLGGLLQVAWLVHKSEERQGRDKDYGEAIISCAKQIIEQLCTTMCGVEVASDTADNTIYKDLYNSILEKFMEAYVKYLLAQKNMLSAVKLEKLVGKESDGEYSVYYRYLKVPNIISQMQEFKWVFNQWKLK